MTQEQALYNRIGSGYDTTRRADPYLASRLAHYLAPQADSNYLDLACGTGNYTAALAAHGGRWRGIDLSVKMLAEARVKHPTTPLALANTAALPFSAATFDGVLCTLAIHHFADLDAAFAEVHRVLVAGGRFVLLTSTPEQMHQYWLSHYFPQAIERSAVQMPALDVVRAALDTAGFVSCITEPYSIREDLQDFFLYSGKHRPEIYLDPGVRRGISTFASLADPVEVENGLSRLAADIDSGTIDRVRERFEHEGGDYLFVAAGKAG